MRSFVLSTAIIFAIIASHSICYGDDYYGIFHCDYISAPFIRVEKGIINYVEDLPENIKVHTKYIYNSIGLVALFNYGTKKLENPENVNPVNFSKGISCSLSLASTNSKLKRIPNIEVNEEILKKLEKKHDLVFRKYIESATPPSHRHPKTNELIEYKYSKGSENIYLINEIGNDNIYAVIHTDGATGRIKGTPSWTSKEVVHFYKKLPNDSDWSPFAKTRWSVLVYDIDGDGVNEIIDGSYYRLQKGKLVKNQNT
jgi:hypothetical protein